MQTPTLSDPMHTFLKQATPPAMTARMRELEASDPRIATLTYMMGRDLVLEWAHSLGVGLDPTLRTTVSPIPPESLRSIVAAREEEIFLWTGARDIDVFMEAYERHREKPSDQTPRVFDFGCGCGRMTRYLDMASGVEGFGSDINEDHVAWCQDNLKNALTKVNGERPPLPFDDAKFDFAYSLSIFTHLKEESAAAWLADLGRVLVPGGILVVTTHGYPALEVIRGSALHHSMFRVDEAWAEAMLAEFDQRPFVFMIYDNDVIESAKAGSSYGNTFIHPSYVERKWNSSLFEVLEHIPGGLRGWQDLYVLRRR